MRHIACMGAMRKAHKIWIKKPEGKQPDSETKCRWKRIILTLLTYVGEYITVLVVRHTCYIPLARRPDLNTLWVKERVPLKYWLVGLKLILKKLGVMLQTGFVWLMSGGSILNVAHHVLLIIWWLHFWIRCILFGGRTKLSGTDTSQLLSWPEVMFHLTSGMWIPFVIIKVPTSKETVKYWSRNAIKMNYRLFTWKCLYH